MKKGSKLPILLGIAAYEGYRFYKGRGIFNKLRFQKQHEAAAKYIETHYPDGFYSELTPTEEGFSCVVSHRGGRVVLYMSKTPDGRFLFWEKAL